MKNKKLLMIPGPSPVVRPILDALSRETVAFGDPAFVKEFAALLADLKRLAQTSGEVFVVAGTGTLAMEMSVANTLKRGDTVLVVSHGYFGDRFVDLCKVKGYDVDVLSAEWGSIVPVDEVRRRLAAVHPSAVVVTHVDTSTGVTAPVEEIGAAVRAAGDALYIVDGVCATAGEREEMESMGIDVLLTGSQKALGVPPGLAIVWAGPRALGRREALGAIPDYYVDWKRWLPIMHDPSKYFATPPVNMIWALCEAVRLVGLEGLSARIARHRRTAEAIHEALEALGFRILAERGCRAATLSCVLYPAGVDDAQFRTTLAEEGAQVSGGLGAYAGKMFRMGHMGNIDEHDVLAAVGAIERTLARMGVHATPGRGTSALLNALERSRVRGGSR